MDNFGENAEDMINILCVLCSYFVLKVRFAFVRIFVFLISIVAVCAYAGEDHSFDGYRSEAEVLLSKDLIGGGYCNSLQDCLSKQFIFYSPADYGFCMHSYGVSSNDTLGKMMQNLLVVSNKMPPGSSICFSANAETKQENLRRHFWDADNVFLTFKITRGKYAKR